MLLGKSLTSQALRPTKTPDLLKTEEAHQWKLSVDGKGGKPCTRLEHNVEGTKWGFVEKGENVWTHKKTLVPHSEVLVFLRKSMKSFASA